MKRYESLGCTMVIKILIQLYFNKKIFFKTCFSQKKDLNCMPKVMHCFVCQKLYWPVQLRFMHFNIH